MVSLVDKVFVVADALTDPEAFDWPTCPTCGKAMRLAGLERAHHKAHINVLTYACICGVVAVEEVANN
jgi:hypothetical protein